MEFISFLLGTKAYAIDVPHVREVVDTPTLSRLPNAPAWITGVMNLRGRVVPVVDLRRVLELVAEAAGRTRGYVIVVELPSEEGVITVGMAVDSVIEVFDLGVTELTASPRFAERTSPAYLRGMARRPHGLVAVIDAEKILAAREETEADSRSTAMSAFSMTSGATT